MITVNTDINAPGCPCEIVNDDGRTLLIQTDWDFPGIASSFSWALSNVQNEGEYSSETPCEHRRTDGTVDCPDCGVTAGEFIDAARNYLELANGETAEDPGYFDAE